MTCATNGRHGHPHLAPLFFDVEERQGGRMVLVAWTYRASQKVRNLRRDPRATVQIESGESYGELAGVTMECDVRIVDDPQAVLATGRRISQRYGTDVPDEQTLARQARKRVLLEFHEARRASWDHRRIA